MNIAEAKQFIAVGDLIDKAPLIQGLHGIGKSEVVHQYAKENGNMHFEPLILSLMDTGDLLGLPRTVEVGGTLSTAWAAPEWYNRIVNAAFPEKVDFEDLSFANEDIQSYIVSNIETTKPVDRGTLNRLYCKYVGKSDDSLHLITQDLIKYTKAKRSVLFLDEFNRAPIDILNACLQLVQDRRLHSHVLPIVDGKPTLIIAAVNPADQDYTVSAFDPAMLDRFMFGQIEPDAKAWLNDYARPNNLASMVRDYIAEHPDRIHYTPADGSVGATPRSWTAVAKVVDNAKNIPNEILFQVFKGLVGMEMASQFLSYYNNYVKVIKMEDIEKLVKTKAKTIKDIEEIGAIVAKKVKDQEAIQKTELANNLFDKYATATSAKDALPLMAYLYALDLEILNGFLKEKKDSATTEYMNIAKIDDELNNKGLFKKIVTKLKA